MSNTVNIDVADLNIFQDEVESGNTTRLKGLVCVINILLMHLHDFAKKDFSPYSNSFSDYKFREFNHLLDKITTICYGLTDIDDLTGMDKVRSMYGYRQLPEKMKEIFKLTETTEIKGMTKEMFFFLDHAMIEGDSYTKFERPPGERLKILPNFFKGAE